MARSRRQQRKQRQRLEAPETSTPEPQDKPVVNAPSDSHPVPLVEPPAEDYPMEIDGEFETEELIAALGPLRRARRHPLVPGIRMFTAMLEEARGGYAADRLGQLEEALGLDFNGLEQEGILQIAMAEMDEGGVPDVEHGVQRALEARAELGVDSVDEDDLPDDVDDQEQPFVPKTEEGRRLAASGASEADVKAMDDRVLEAAAEENAATAEDGEPEDPDAPGPDEQ